MSFYTKYRPHDFENLVWQDFIKQTLKTAIAENKTVWAYLFCWPRWTWKTSTARILAKTINCENQKDWNPCLTCSICKDFLLNKLIDIIEIDAASHTWVDNIRDIIEKAQFSATKTRFKVYIIDEVHMLSKWAFNALLKILEEPPLHVKFILATTEIDKVPETILSRCQRYDFKSINLDDIKNRLNFIAKKEKIKIDDDSLNYIANASSWWLRNAINLFEQLLNNNEIVYENIKNTLWLVTDDLKEVFLDKLLKQDKSVLDDFEKVIQDWKNTKLFFKDLLFYIKGKTIKKLKKWDDILSLISILDKINESYTKSKYSLDENTVFIIWILKIISWYSEDIPQAKVITKLSKAKEKKEVKQTIVSNKEENGSFIKDAEDIFSIEEEEIKKPVSQKIESNNSNFNKEDFISEIKKHWAKASITMSLRWADFTEISDTLQISFKTKFALNSMNNNENIEFLNKALTWIWKENLKIKLSS